MVSMSSRKIQRVALLGALPQEVQAFRKRIKKGKWNGKKVLVGLTGVGKAVAAARTQKMISEFKPDAVIFTGAAGALSPELTIGSIGVIVAGIDAEMDVRSLNSSYKKGEYYLTRERIFSSDSNLVRLAFQSPVRQKLFEGFTASTSKFLNASEKKRFIREGLPELAAVIGGKTRKPNLVEMECSAVFQTCRSNDVPCLALRAVSDSVEGDAANDFNEFIKSPVEECVELVDFILKNV